MADSRSTMSLLHICQQNGCLLACFSFNITQFRIQNFAPMYLIVRTQFTYRILSVRESWNIKFLAFQPLKYRNADKRRLGQLLSELAPSISHRRQGKPAYTLAQHYAYTHNTNSGLYYQRRGLEMAPGTATRVSAMETWPSLKRSRKTSPRRRRGTRRAY